MSADTAANAPELPSRQEGVLWLIESQIALFALTDDAAEGQIAFREKRKPKWSGR